MLDNQAKLQNRFQAAFTKMTVLGHNVNDLIDCSEVIPQPPSFTGKATFPAGFSIGDGEQAVCKVYLRVFMNTNNSSYSARLHHSPP